MVSLASWAYAGSSQANARSNVPACTSLEPPLYAMYAAANFDDESRDTNPGARYGHAGSSLPANSAPMIRRHVVSLRRVQSPKRAVSNAAWSTIVFATSRPVETSGGSIPYACWD